MSFPRKRGVLAAALTLALTGGLAVTSAGPVALAAPAAPAAEAAEQISSFTLGVLPDTQFYSRYATTEEGKQFQTRYGTEPFSSQTKWLVDNDEKLGIPFVTHLGDVVDQVGKPEQWTVASNAMKILEDGLLPYSILPGNHDVSADWQTDAQRTPGSEPYLGTFPASRAAIKNPTTFGGRDPLGYSEWHVFEKDGQSYLQLALTWGASDATIAWAQGVLDAHKNMPTILTSHQLLNIAPSGVGPAETDFGLKIWNRLISPNNQVFMTLGGHHHGNANWIKKNAAGNPVLQIVNDYQMAYQGGNGYLGLYEFDFTNSQIRASQVSPWVVTKSLVLVNQFDQAVLRKSNERYDVPFDLTGRFSAINANFEPGPADHSSYTEKAVEILYENYTEPVIPEREAAENESDYYDASNTVAHWTFDGADGTPVGVGETIADTTGNNPLKRAKLINGAQLGDVTYSNVSHPLAANQGSVCFTNSDRDTKRLSYLSTAANTPLTKERFPNGYTIETFIKVDEKWTQEKNRWMSAIAAGGTRVAGSSDGEAPPFFMGISNLLEVQWSVDPTNAVAKTNWSGEISKDVWLHVAAVNDTGTQTTTLYIEGAPVLRNSNGGVTGIETILGAAWKLGASSDYGTPDGGFLGCIGETRIVAQPLSADQWLTSRAAHDSTQTNSASSSDDFDRHNGLLGSDWADARGNWAIKNKDAVVADSLGSNVASYTPATLGDSFTTRATLSHATQNGNAQWVGTAFNINGTTPSTLNYYMLRYAPVWGTTAVPTTTSNRWQLVKVVDGATPTVIREGTFTANPSQPIEATVSRDREELKIGLEDYLGQSVLNLDVTLADFPAKRGGYAGLASNNADLVARSFTVTNSTAPVAPNAPTLSGATVANDNVEFGWAAPAVTGGSAITGYTATLSKLDVAGSLVTVDTADYTADARSGEFTKLAPGDYVVSVRATNAVADSAESEVSAVLTVQAQTPGEPEVPAIGESVTTIDVDDSSYGIANLVTASVDAGEATATGDVELFVDGTSYSTVALEDGVASIALPARLAVGNHTITADYLGTSEVKGSDDTAQVAVAKAVVETTLSVSKTRAVVKKSKITATVRVSVPDTAIVATGKVQIRVEGKLVKTVTLKASSKGKLTFTLPVFTKTGSRALTATYLGTSTLAKDASPTVTMRVVR